MIRATRPTLWTRWSMIMLGLFVLLSMFACEGGSGSVPTADPLDPSIFDVFDSSEKTSRFRILVTDAPIDGIESVWLTVSEVSIHSVVNGWQVISTDLQTFDLLGLRYGVTRTLGIEAIPAGSYDQIRLLVEDASIVVNGVSEDLYVPGGMTKGVLINFEFSVDENQIATMVIDWDAAASIHYAPGEGYILYSAITVRSYRTEGLDNEAPPAPLVDSPTHPDQDIWTAVNDATFHFSAQDNLGVDGFSYTFDQFPTTVPDEIADKTIEDDQPFDCQPSFYSDVPVCDSYAPNIAIEGSLITITGAHFGYWTSAARVKIGDQLADIVEISPNEMVVRVPDGMGAQLINIATPKGEVTCDRYLEVVSDRSFCPNGNFEVGKGLLGEVWRVCEGQENWDCVLPDFDTMGPPHSTIATCELEVPNHYFSEGFPGVDETLVEWFGIRFSGELVAPTSGNYEFKIVSDDGANLYVDDTKVVDNDGVHTITTATGGKHLAAGNHTFRVDYFQGPRWYIALQVYWKKPGDVDWSIIPQDYLRVPPRYVSEELTKPICYCSGHGPGAYNYRSYSVSDGDGKMYRVDLYDDFPTAVELGVIKGSGNRVLTDFESLAILNHKFYGINNDGVSQVAHRLYEVFPEQASNGTVPTNAIGELTHDGVVVQDLDCLAASPDDLLYAISTSTNKLYTVNTSNAELTEVMDVSGEMEGCAFGPSGLLYTLDNSGEGSDLMRIDIVNKIITKISDLPYKTDVEALGWHPDGFLYAGIDNTGNNYPAIAKISAIDGTVVGFLDPTVKMADIEGIDFDFEFEEETCACEMSLDGANSISATGSVSIIDSDGDDYSDLVSFTGDQMITNVTPESDALHAYTGIHATCLKPKSRVVLSSLALDPIYYANRFSFSSTNVPGGFALQLIQPDCSYQSVVIGDIDAKREYIFATGNHASFWIKMINPIVTNTIGSGFLNALAVQDTPAAIMFTINIGTGSIQQQIKTGQTISGSGSFTMQAGKNIIGVEDAGDLPVCPDPATHNAELDGTVTYTDIEDGIWYFHARVIDDAGNWGEAAHYRVKIDSSPPEPPVIKSPTHVSSEMEYTNPSPVFNWTASDLCGIAGYSYVLDTDPATDPSEEVMTSDPTKTFAEQEPGVYWMHVAAKNNTGLWSAPAHFMIQIAEPKEGEGELEPPPPGFVGRDHTIYLMGSPSSQSDRFTDEDQHWVEVGPFLIHENEVTNSDYRACVSKYAVTQTACSDDDDCAGDREYCNTGGKCATGCENTPLQAASYWIAAKTNHPVAYISWRDAYVYCRTSGYRLPTEAEWEFAARDEDFDRYPWGDTYAIGRANGVDLGIGETLNVGSFDGQTRDDGSACVGESCVYDMAGNVEEWVSDYYHTYQVADTADDAVPFPNIDTREECVATCQGDSTCVAYCDMKVTRGGSFLGTSRQLRVYYRNKLPGAYKADNIGFRCAMDWTYDEELEPIEVCDGVDNDNDDLIDEGFDNTDNDDLANCVDDDDDNDGIEDVADNCPLNPNTDQADPDMDGFGEVCDIDGENLTVHYAGLIRPWDVVMSEDGSIFAAGSKDGYDLTSDNNNEKGTVLSVNVHGIKSGQVYLADTTGGNTYWEDFRPNKISMSPYGALYVTDEKGSYDDGIWKIIRNEDTNQLGIDVSPQDRNGGDGTAERFWSGDENERGIGYTSGNAIDNEGEWIYVTRANARQVRRFQLDENGNVTDTYGVLGQEVATLTKAVFAPAIDKNGDLFYIREGKLVRQRIVDGQVQTVEELSDNKAFANASDLAFDPNNNLYVLSSKGTSNVWPFVGDTADMVVGSESGYISKVPADVLEKANTSNIIMHGDESKQMLIYGGPESKEIVYNNKRLRNPLGMYIDPITGQIVVANTDKDEIVVLSVAQRRIVKTIGTAGDYYGLP